ncbi:MAG: N-acetylmuramoyl-L-alanine amidase [Parvibaculaceae bacterium]
MLGAASPAGAGEQPSPRASAVKIGVDGTRTRITIDVSLAVSFNVYVLPDPYRTIIDLPEMDFQLPAGAGREGAGIVSGYRFGKLDKGRSRVVIDASGPVLIEKSYAVQGRNGKPASLVVELFPTDAETFARVNQSELAQKEAVAPDAQITDSIIEPASLPPEEIEAKARQGRGLAPLPRPKPDRAEAARKTLTIETPSRPRNARRVVVIDPGHGGIDPGAVGVKGTAEKDVVLAFARALREALEASGRYKVVMTRDKDVFLTLRDRVRVARSNEAELFIALHADALRRSDTRGATVYTLSDKASDAEAEALAQKENRADIIGGVDLGHENEEITGILIDLAQRETRNHSTFFAKQLAAGMKPVTRFTSRPIRSAGFRVLKAPDIPSVLLELGYISSASDEALLTSPAWRSKVSRSIAAAVDDYFAARLAAR